MNLFKSLAVAAALFAISMTAHAAPLYANVHVGAATQAGISGINLDDGQVYGAAIGTAVGPLRVEAGVDRHNVSIANIINGHATVYNASAFADFRLGTQSAVYVGGGVDYGQVSAHIGPWTAARDSGFGYHAATGYSRRISDGLILDAQARYTHLDVANGASDVALTAGLRVAL